MEIYQLPIPKDIWGSMVLSRLSLKDFIRCSAVCRCWRRIAIENQRSLHSLPWVMLSQDENTHTALFYSLREGITYKLKFTDSASKSVCTGSTHSNLAFSDGEANFVFNPFTQHTTLLPPQYVPPRHSNDGPLVNRRYYKKSILSASDPSRLLAASLCTSSMVISVTCSSDDKKWSVFGIERCPSLLIPEPKLPPLPPQEEEEEEDPDALQEDEEEEEEDPDAPQEDDEEEEEEVEKEDDLDVPQENDEEEEEEEYDPDDARIWSLMDIMFYKGILYGLSELSTLVRFYNLEDANAKPQQVMNMVPMEMPDYSHPYLVESSCGDLLMVYRIRNQVNPMVSRYVTKGFLVFKLDDKSGDELRWVAVESLGDEMIFLGKNSSMSFSAKDIPGLKGNRIYFTDDAFEFWPWSVAYIPVFFTDNGVFHLEDGRIECLLPPGLSTSLKSQPIWVMPAKLVVGVDHN